MSEDTKKLVSSALHGLWLSKRKYKNKVKDISGVDLQNEINQSQIAIHGKVPPAIVPITASPGDYQCDLMFTDYAKFNGGKGIIINLIHTESRYLYSEMIKTKSAAVDYLTKVIPTLNPKMTQLTVDAGTEFINKKLKDFCDKNNINLIPINKSLSSGSSFILGIVERVNRTIRDLTERFITTSGRTGTSKYKFEDIYDDLITNYNTSDHSGINNTPEDLLKAYQNPETKQNANLIINTVLPKIKLQEENKAKIRTKFPINSYVYVLSKTKLNYEKGSIAKFDPTPHKVLGYSGYRVIIDSNGTNPAQKQYEKKLYHELKPAGKGVNEKAETKPSLQPKKELKLVKTLAAINRKEKREQTSTTNVIPTKRERKAPTRINL